MQVQSRSFAKFRNYRQQLLQLIRRHRTLVGPLEMSAWGNRMVQLEEQVLDDTFKVLVLGEFNRGKSTLINALLGQPVLPMKATPTTAIITEVKWASSKWASMVTDSWDGEGAPTTTSVDIRDIEQYVVINDDDRVATRRQAYRKLQLYWPLDLCREGVEIIDSPGLNEDEDRKNITMTYLASVDAAIFVLACDQAVSTSEKSVISALRTSGHDNIFFVCNRVDLLRSPQEQEDVKRHVLQELDKLKVRTSNRIFFVSAQTALDGRIGNDDNRWQSSNLPLLEEQLKNFLANERGQAKLLRPALVLRRAVDAVRDQISEKRQLVMIDIKTQQERKDRAEIQLAHLEGDRASMEAQWSALRQLAKTTVRRLAANFYRTVEPKVEGWAITYQLTRRPPFMSVFSKSAIEEVVNEVALHLTDQLLGETREWRESTLQPQLDEICNKFLWELQQGAERFEQQLAQIRRGLVGNDAVPSSTEPGNDSDQIVSVEWFNDRLSIAGTAVMKPWRAGQFIASLLPQAALVAGATVVIGLNPWFLIPTLLAGDAFVAYIGSQTIAGNIKRAVGKRYSEQLVELHEDMVDGIVSEIDASLRTVQSETMASLELQINDIRDQLTSMRDDASGGEKHAKLENLDRLDVEAQTISTEMNELLGNIAEFHHGES